MLTIKRLFQKGAKPHEAISELKPLPITEVTPAMLTTLSNINKNFAFGWSDPRIMYPKTYEFKFADFAPVHGHYARSMTNEQLRAAWLILFGSEEVWFNRIRGVDNEDDWLIAYEAYSRGLLNEYNDINVYGYKYTLKQLNAHH